METFSPVFTKMCGAGNDFLITDSTRLFSPTLSSKEKEERTHSLIQNIPKLCERKFGLGADGVSLLFVSKTNGAHLDWQFFNKDGSKASMCGNAACCIVHYADKKKLIPKSANGDLVFQIQNTRLKGRVNAGSGAELILPLPQIIEKKDQAVIDGREIPFVKVNSGVPHLLIEQNEIKSMPQNTPVLKNLAQKLRSLYPDFNITFYAKKEKNEIICTCFERGVEDFTLSCGTGAVAVSFLLKETSSRDSFSVQMPGGALKVFFEKSSARLSSPVYWIAEMRCLIPYE